MDGQKLWIPAEPSESDLNAIRNDPVKLADIRERLSDISWWMRLLVLPVVITLVVIHILIDDVLAVPIV